MTAETTNSAPTDVLTAARVLLSQMGVSPEALTGTPVIVPTFAEIVPQVRATLTPGTLRTYNTHLVRLETEWGTRQVNEPSKSDLEEMARAVRRDTRLNRASRGGSGAVANFLSATRCVYRYAEDLPWVALHGITAHWLRHTTLTWVERTFSYAVAQA